LNPAAVFKRSPFMGSGTFPASTSPPKNRIRNPYRYPLVTHTMRGGRIFLASGDDRSVGTTDILHHPLVKGVSHMFLAFFEYLPTSTLSAIEQRERPYFPPIPGYFQRIPPAGNRIVYVYSGESQCRKSTSIVLSHSFQAL